MQENELDLITLEEGAELLKIGIATFRKHIEEKRIPAVQVSDKIQMVRKQDVINFVNNQVKKIESNKTDNQNPLDEVNEQIELTKKRQELEALNAGFKTAEEFKKAFDTLKSEKEKLEQAKKQFEIDKRAFDLYKIQSESEIAEAKAKNIEDKERILNLGKEYKKKWQMEDEKRKNESKLVINHLDELGKTIYNSHPCYLGKLAKEKLAKDFEPVLAYYGIPAVFNKKGEYISLSSRLSFDNAHELTTERNNAFAVLDKSQIVGNVKTAYDNLLRFYKWILKVQGGYDFASWLFEELKILDSIITDKTNEELESSLDTLLEHFMVINKEMIALALRFDKSNHPNQVSDSSATEYILKVSDEIEHLLGVVSGEE